MSNIIGQHYLSSPYSHSDIDIVKQRVFLTIKATSLLINKGYFIFSPIVHGHPMIEAGMELKGDWEFWKDYCLEYLSNSKSMFVLKIDGWEESSGIKGEIEFANQNNIKIYYVYFNKTKTDLIIE